HRASAQRRAEADDAAARQFRIALQRLQRDESAEAVSDEMDAAAFERARALEQQGDADLGPARDTRIVEDVDGVAGAFEPMAQRDQGERAHPQAVQEYDVFGHAGISECEGVRHALSMRMVWDPVLRNGAQYRTGSTTLAH